MAFRENDITIGSAAMHGKFDCYELVYQLIALRIAYYRLIRYFPRGRLANGDDGGKAKKQEGKAFHHGGLSAKYWLQISGPPTTKNLRPERTINVSW